MPESLFAHPSPRPPPRSGEGEPKEVFPPLLAGEGGGGGVAEQTLSQSGRGFPMRRFLLPALMVLALLVGGVLHGMWSDRWVPESKARIAAAGARITAFSRDLGDWKGVNND